MATLDKHGRVQSQSNAQTSQQEAGRLANQRSGKTVIAPQWAGPKAFTLGNCVAHIW